MLIADPARCVTFEVSHDPCHVILADALPMLAPAPTTTGDSRERVRKLTDTNVRFTRFPA